MSVTLTGGSLATPLTDVTDVNGAYGFDNLQPGDYIVTLGSGVPADHVSTTGGNTSAVTVVSGDARPRCRFRSRRADHASVTWCGTTSMATAPSTPGSHASTAWASKLVDGGGNVIATATTSGGGAYAFTDVAPSPLDYTVRIVTATVPAGYDATTPESIDVTVTSDDDVTDADFGYATTRARSARITWRTTSTATACRTMALRASSASAG